MATAMLSAGADTGPVRCHLPTQGSNASSIMSQLVGSVGHLNGVRLQNPSMLEGHNWVGLDAKGGAVI